MEKTPIIKFYDVFDHFSKIGEVAKFLMIKLYLQVSDVMHTNEQTEYVNCGLHANFWIFFVNFILFYDEKESF